MTHDKKEALKKKDRNDMRMLAACLGIAITGISWMLFGPIGLFIGGTCGMIAALKFIKSANDAIDEEGQTGYNASQKNQTGSFKLSLLVLTAMVMRADGRITRGELDEFKHFWKSRFGEQQTLEALQLLKQMVAQDSDYLPICRQIGQHMSYSARLELLHFLLRVAAADYLAGSEVNLIASMAAAMGISRADYLSVLQAFLHHTRNEEGGQQSEHRNRTDEQRTANLQWAYQLLQIDASASDEEVKKAYRRMAMKYHPDKVASLGESVRRSATEKFKEVGEAYDQIKRARGMN